MPSTRGTASTIYSPPTTSLMKVRPLVILKVTTYPQLATRTPLLLTKERTGSKIIERSNTLLETAPLCSRHIEQGILVASLPKEVYLKFEQFPIWLMMLDELQVS
jgi:hypothetical protein